MHTKIVLLLTVAIISGCSLKSAKVDMSSYSLKEFRTTKNCNFNKQCKSMPFGFSHCGNMPDGYAGYFVYSTKIGRKNIKALKKRIALDKQEQIDNGTGAFECTYLITQKPELVCQNHVCTDRRLNDI